MMDSVCSLAFRHKKGEYFVEFLLLGGVLFILVGTCGVWIVSRCFTLYFTFLALTMFLIGIFMLGGVVCFVGTLYVSCFKLFIDLYL